MSYGSTAYASYVRIRSESDERLFPRWSALPHVRRLAWEAAAQAVALAVLPLSMTNDPSETGDEPFDDDHIVTDDDDDDEL